MSKDEIKDEYLEDYTEEELSILEENEGEMEDDEYELNIEDVVEVASGLDEYNNPMASAMLTITEFIDEEKTKSVMNVSIINGSFNFFISGGCAIIEIDIPKKNSFEYRRIMSLCKEWFSNEEDNKNRIVSAIIVPRLLKGQIVITFEELVYYTGIVDENGSRVILGFDNNLSNVIENHNIDYDRIQKEVEKELMDEEKELERQYYEARKELDELENLNYYEEKLKEKMLYEIKAKSLDEEDDTDDEEDDTDDEENHEIDYGSDYN